MKYQPYKEILDIKSELKEYKKLCRCKSKKFTYYSDWKSHIINLISKTDSIEQIDNFKHYLLNYKRVNKNVTAPYVPLIIFAMTVVFNLQEFKSDLIVIIFGILFILIVTLKEYDNYNKNFYFYKDVIEIIDEIEKEKRRT